MLSLLVCLVGVIFIRHLRTGYGGLLRMNPAFADHGLKDLLPLRLKDPDEGCTRLNRSQYCFDAGMLLVIKFKNNLSSLYAL